MMKYRDFGRHKLQISEIGLGGHREGVETRQGIERTARYFLSAQERAKVVGLSIDRGMTYFDTTYGCEMQSLGESLRILGRRDGLFVSGMRVDFFRNLSDCGADPRSYTRREVEGRLRDFSHGHIDQFMLGAAELGDPLGLPPAVLDDVFDELDRLRAEGKFRFLGFSCHDPDYASRLLKAWPKFDSVMTPYNPFNRAAEGQLAAALRQTGAAWIVMKPLVWSAYGLPITMLRNIVAAGGAWNERTPVAAMALRFILDNPLVTTIVPAMNTTAEVDENLAASGAAPLGSPEIRHLDLLADAVRAEGKILLAIGGLLTDNLRVRSCALRVLAVALHLDLPPIDYESDHAQDAARAAADKFLHVLAGTRQWSEFLPAHGQPAASRR